MVVNFELSSYCNAKCPSCARQDTKNILNKRHLDFSLFTKIIQNNIEYFISQECKFCGEFSDPLLHPEIQKFIHVGSLAFQHVFLFTNGGIRNPRWFKNIMIKFPNFTPVFAIDGINHEINQIYRKNVNTNLAMKNMLTSISIDPERVWWHFTVFSHNYHQTKEVIDMAKFYDIGLVVRINDRDFNRLEDKNIISDLKQYYNNAVKDVPFRRRTPWDFY